MPAPRVLVADDEEIIRALVVQTLRMAGFEIVEAIDGRDAIAKLDAGHFNALVLDVMMPHVDGWGVIEHLLKTQPAMVSKTVLLTAFPHAAERGRDLCCVVAKPFEVLHLIAEVRRCAAAA